jgi:hypothetical protein
VLIREQFSSPLSWELPAKLHQFLTQAQPNIFLKPSLPVDDTALQSPSSMRLRPCFSHRQSALHSPFPSLCGRRGKQGPPYPPSSLLFQNSRNAQSRFRKLRTLSTHLNPTTSEAFPLFHPQLRVLLSFLLIILPFSYYPSHPHRLARKIHVQSPAARTSPLSSPNPVIQRSPSFSTRTQTLR